MKIRSYELFQVPPRWLFLKIETDEGITGWGEPVIEGKAATVKAAVEELMEYLVGKDPMPIEDHWNTMYRAEFAMSRLFSPGKNAMPFGRVSVSMSKVTAPFFVILYTP